MLSPEEVWAENVDLLLPVLEDDARDLFVQAIFVAFGINDYPVLMHGMRNRDLLATPEPYGSSQSYNAFQFAACRDCNKDPILTTFSYLFCSHDPYYGEAYFYVLVDPDHGLSPSEAKEFTALREFRKRVKAEFPSARDYVERVMTILFWEDLANVWDEYETWVAKACFDL